MEDLLQDNVKRSIILLREANIKVWMLTGDKMETARCISISTGLLGPRDEVWLVENVIDSHKLNDRFREFLLDWKPERVGFVQSSVLFLTN